MSEKKIVRVLRLVEFVGEEQAVAKQVEHSLDGTCLLSGRHVQVTAKTLPQHFTHVGAPSDPERIDDFLSLARQHLTDRHVGVPQVSPEAAEFWKSLGERGDGWTESLYDEDRRQIADACLQQAERQEKQSPSDTGLPSRVLQLAQKFAAAAQVVLSFRGHR